MAYHVKQYAVTTSAAKLTTVLGTSELRPMQIDIKNANASTGIVYLGKSNVTNAPANAGVQLSAGQGWSYLAGSGSRHVSTEEIYIVGSVGAETVFITVFE